MVIPRSAVALCSAALLAGFALPAQAQSPNHSPAPSQSPPPRVGWVSTDTGSTEEFRGLAAVSKSTAWVSGEAGSVLRTTDRGATWQDVSPAGAKGHGLRDIEAFDANHAVTLSIGKGRQSRIWLTDDGGTTWKQTFINKDPNAFYDCMAFSSDGTGLAMSDPVDGRFRLISSADRGKSWNLLTPKRMPKAMKVEFGFAASGTCLVSGPGHEFWIASGGTHPRVFRTLNAGVTWTVADTPIRGGASAGIYSIAFRDAQQGVAVGGDYTDPTNRKAAAATTADGGKTWALSKKQVFGYRSGVAYKSSTTVIAVGPTGSDISRDGGVSWRNFDQTSYDGVQCASTFACWASGSKGAVSYLSQ